MSDITFLSASELARKIQERKLSSTEVVTAYLNKIEKYNSALNAICTIDAAGALEKAKEADAVSSKGESWGVLHGVPITLKDMFETAGLRTTTGYIPLKDYVPKQDATIARQ